MCAKKKRLLLLLLLQYAEELSLFQLFLLIQTNQQSDTAQDVRKPAGNQMPVSTFLCSMPDTSSSKCPVMQSNSVLFSTWCFWDFNVRAPVIACIEENTPHPNTCSHSSVFSILRALRGPYDDC